MRQEGRNLRVRHVADVGRAAEQLEQARDLIDRPVAVECEPIRRPRAPSPSGRRAAVRSATSRTGSDCIQARGLPRKHINLICAEHGDDLKEQGRARHEIVGEQQIEQLVGDLPGALCERAPGRCKTLKRLRKVRQGREQGLGGIGQGKRIGGLQLAVGRLAQLRQGRYAAPHRRQQGVASIEALRSLPASG